MGKQNFQIAHGHIPKVLLMGNGINRAYGFASWEALIKSIQIKEFNDVEQVNLKNVPYPLQTVIRTEDHIDVQMKKIAGQLSELSASSEEQELLRAFASLPVDGILTANYTYELEKTLCKQFKCLPARRCKERTLVYNESGVYNQRQLHTCFSLDGFPPIWHIHGEASRYDTMVLGHYYYGKLLSKMQQYVSKLIVRYKVSITKQQEMSLYSWLDYFMLGDVYIIGLGMDLAEMDLWWLINCKKRHFPDRKVVLYKPDIKLEERLLAEAYGVTVETKGFNGEYIKYYKWVYETLKGEIE